MKPKLIKDRMSPACENFCKRQSVVYDATGRRLCDMCYAKSKQSPSVDELRADERNRLLADSRYQARPATSGGILALDLATRTGAAYMRRDSVFGWADVWDLGTPGDHLGNQLARLRDLLDETIERYPVRIVYAEHGARGSVAFRALEFHGEMRGVLLCWAADRGLPVRFVNPSTLKKWATGNGHAEKSQMISAAQTLSGNPDIRDDNAADACNLAFYARDELQNGR